MVPKLNFQKHNTNIVEKHCLLIIRLEAIYYSKETTKKNVGFTYD